MKPKSTPTASAKSRVWLVDFPSWVGVMLIAAAVALAWCNSISGPFLFDDESSIISNASIRDLTSFRWIQPPAGSGETVGGRPVLNLSFALNYALSGIDVRWFRLTNIAIHALAAATLFEIIRRTLRISPFLVNYRDAATSIATAVALIWAVHPLQTEAVTYIVQRAESLGALFYLLTLYFFILSIDKPLQTLRWTTASIAACILGVATKETVATAPITLLLYHRAFIAGSFTGTWRNRSYTYIGYSLAWITLGTLVLMNPSRGGSAGWNSPIPALNYAWAQCSAICHYCSLAFWPSGQVFDYGTYLPTEISEVMPQLILLCLSLALALWFIVKNSIVGFICAWFFLALAPSSSFVPIATQTAAEHRMYLALAPLILLTTFLLRTIVRRPLFRGITVAMAVLALGAATFARNRTYASELVLWQDTATKVPNNPRAHNNLGLALAKTGRTSEAKQHFIEAVNLQAKAWQPNQAVAHFNLGNVLMTQNLWDSAATQFRAALTYDPHYTSARIHLGLALMRSNRKAEAIEQFKESLREDNGAQDARTNLAAMLIADGKIEEGITHLRVVLTAAPDWAIAHYHLGVALEKSGLRDQAEREFHETLRLRPTFAEAHLALGNLAMNQNQIGVAESLYREAVRLDSGLAEAHFALGNVAASRQQYESAAGAYQAALKVDPNHIQARNNLANCQLATGKVLDAISNYREVLRLQPNEETAEKNLAIALQMERSR